jgi:hypothetical protein
MEPGTATTWTPSHAVPEGGLPAWSAPDPSQPAAAQADGGRKVQALESRGDWTRVSFSNGWEAWVDGRRLTPLQRPSAMVPAGGLAAWAAPDRSQAPVAQAAAGLQVRILETSGDWAHVEFTNGWTAWVDGRALTSGGAALPTTLSGHLRDSLRPGRRITPLPAIGCALIVLGSFLPWASALGVSVTAWDLSAWGLLTRQATASNLRAGVPLLVTLVACVPYLTRRPFPRLVDALLACIPTSLTIGGLLLARQLPGVGIGLGGVLTFIGALVLAAEAVVTVKGKP